MTAPHDLWWKLPGPSGFVKYVVDAVEAGELLLYFAPPHAPAELDTVLKNEIEGRTHHQLRVGELTAGKTVDQAVAEALGTPQGISLESQFQNPSNDSTVVRLRGAADGPASVDPVALVQRLKAYKDDYKGRTRQMSLWLDVPPSSVDPAVSGRGLRGICRSCYWYNQVSREDMRAYVGVLMAHRDNFEPQGLLREIVFELAGFDRGWADHLAQLPDDSLLDPTSYLHQGVPPTWGEPKWENGDVDMMRAERVISSKHHARVRAQSLTGNNADAAATALTQLLWKAQLRTIFPWLEVARPLALKTIEKDLRTFVESGKVLDAYQDPPGPYDWDEIEYGDACHIISVAKGAGIWVSAPFIQTARHVRNELAHRRPIAMLHLQKLEKHYPKP